MKRAKLLITVQMRVTECRAGRTFHQRQGESFVLDLCRYFQSPAIIIARERAVVVAGTEYIECGWSLRVAVSASRAATQTEPLSNQDSSGSFMIFTVT